MEVHDEDAARLIGLTVRLRLRVSPRLTSRPISRFWALR